MRKESVETDREAKARLQRFRDEVARIDITCFSPRMQATIRDYEQAMAAIRQAHETNMERLRRLHPHLSDEECVDLALWSAFHQGKRRPMEGS